MNKSNPYAFPQSEFNDSAHSDYNGMTLRDYFAAKAMQAIISKQPIFDASGDIGNELPKDHHKRLAMSAYYMADAMLLEREK